jgi:hypothetical protein
VFQSLPVLQLLPVHFPELTANARRLDEHYYTV